MNFKNIPDDIENKSIEEIQKEVSEIIEILEKEENLENSTDRYQRLILLKNCIEKKFQKKFSEISKKNFQNTKKSFSKT